MNLENLIKKYEATIEKETLIVQEKEDLIKLHEQVFTAVANLENQASEILKSRSEVQEQLKVAMRDNGVNKFENDLLAITYVAPYDKTTLDVKALKEAYPVVYDAYLRTTSVKDSIRIKIK